MCVILSITQLNKNKKIQEELVANIEEAKEYNKDGIGIIGANTTNNDFVCRREMKCSASQLFNLLDRFNLLNIHLRQATSGVVARKNVHFWQKKNWFFAHNGAIGDYPEGKYSDSFLFFQELCNRHFVKQNGIVLDKKISALKDEKTFWGRFLLYHQPLRKTFFFGDFHTYALAEDALVVATKELDFSEYFHLCGIRFDKTAPFQVLHRKMDGIFSLTLKRKSFNRINFKFGNIERYGGSAYWGKNNAYDEEYSALPDRSKDDNQRYQKHWQNLSEEERLLLNG